VSLAFREGTNMAVSVLYNQFGKGLRKAVYLFSTLSTVVFFAFFTYFGVLEVIDEVRMRVMTEAMELPVWLFTVSMPTMGLFTIVRVIMKTRSDLRSENW
jgi:TRAP-type C4-dicarboxylate transport system permease small subunit